MKSSRAMEYGVLGDDILAAILSLLPKKTLCRFKCVSKAWQSLISDRSRVSPKTSHAGLLCKALAPEQPPPMITRPSPSLPPLAISPCRCQGLFPQPSSIATHLSMTFLRTLDDGSASDLPSLSFFMERHVYIIGTCNGLLLLTNIYPLKHPISFVVYDPVTDQSTHVPFLAIRQNPIRIGFAYNGQCYHVIRISHNYGATALELDIFSSEAGEWRVKHLPLPHSSGSYDSIAPLQKLQSLFFRGAVHWLLRGFILIFDLKEENSEFVELPQSGFYFDECIWAWEGSLSYCKSNTNGIQIWIRHTQGRREGSWELKHSAVLAIPAAIGTSSCMFEPCAFNDDFEIVYLKCSGRLFSYKLENGALKEVRYGILKECSVVPFWSGPQNWIECETICAVFPFWNGPVNSIEQA